MQTLRWEKALYHRNVWVADASNGRYAVQRMHKGAHAFRVSLNGIMIANYIRKPHVARAWANGHFRRTYFYDVAFNRNTNFEFGAGDNCYLVASYTDLLTDFGEHQTSPTRVYWTLVRAGAAARIFGVYSAVDLQSEPDQPRRWEIWVNYRKRAAIDLVADVIGVKKVMIDLPLNTVDDNTV